MKDFVMGDRWINQLATLATANSMVESELYVKYNVKRGLRDLTGKGVLAGLTRIGDVSAKEIVNGESVPAPGRLIYRGIDIHDLVNGFLDENRSGYEETCYLLLFGVQPNASDLQRFNKLLSRNRTLPKDFIHNCILEWPGRDMMNALARAVLALYVTDAQADDTDIANTVRQSLALIAAFPLMAVYAYQAYAHRYNGKSLVIHSHSPNLGTAANFLHMLRDDSSYTPLEAQLLDLALVLHAEHGGGNNSTFTTHVVTSTGTDIYSAIAAALGSLKGPRHGGANIKVVQMLDDLKAAVKDPNDDLAIEDYLSRLLNKEAFDRSGLIYGMGHAVYSISDPRTLIIRDQVRRLAQEKGMDEEFTFYAKVERLGPQIIADRRKMYKGVSANVDFYSGLLYRLLNIPVELYTPLFAVSRIAGWCAHRIEEIANRGKIIRPAYNSVVEHIPYLPLNKRT
jgi:citrate synthase